MAGVCRAAVSTSESAPPPAATPPPDWPRAVGWSIADCLRNELLVDALEMTCRRRRRGDLHWPLSPDSTRTFTGVRPSALSCKNCLSRRPHTSRYPWPLRSALLSTKRTTGNGAAGRQGIQRCANSCAAAADRGDPDRLVPELMARWRMESARRAVGRRREPVARQLGWPGGQSALSRLAIRSGTTIVGRLGGM